MSDAAIGMLVSTVLIIVIMGLGWGLGAYRCSAQWESSGMATSWGPFQGCLIQHDNKWIPSAAYREMP